jgi:hypothetical protein
VPKDEAQGLCSKIPMVSRPAYVSEQVSSAVTEFPQQYGVIRLLSFSPASLRIEEEHLSQIRKLLFSMHKKAHDGDLDQDIYVPT